MSVIQPFVNGTLNMHKERINFKLQKSILGFYVQALRVCDFFFLMTHKELLFYWDQSL